MADYGSLSRLVRRADSVAADAASLVSRALRDVRGEIANLSAELNLAGSADDREKAYAAVRGRMAELAERLDRLLSAQNDLAARTAAKSASADAGVEVKYSARRAEAVIETVTPAQGDSLAAVFTDRMARSLVNSLREATVSVLREQAVSGGSLKSMAEEMRRRWTAAADGEPRFTDAAGREWDTATYFQMNVRTNTMRVYNDCLVDDLARATGSDLVRVSTGGSDPHCACAAWEGAILSVSGKTKGFPTYEQARQGGCFHPNCVHTLEAVDEFGDADEIARQKRVPFDADAAGGDLADAQDERKYRLDIAERMERDGLAEGAARLAVDRANLAASIRAGLLREDADALVARLTDAQVAALVKDGDPPQFAPVKRVRGGTREKPKYEAERWRHGSRGGVVHVSRDATAERIAEVCGVKDAKGEEDAKGSGGKGAGGKAEGWTPQTDVEKATDALMKSIGAKHTDAPLGIEGTNPNYSKGREWRINCQRCVPAYEARCRGYDVTAKPNTKAETGQIYDNLAPFSDNWLFPQVEGAVGIPYKKKKDIEAKMEEWGDGARCQIVCKWKGGRKSGAHTFMAVQKEGKTHFVDPQSGNENCERYFKSISCRGRGTSYAKFARIDNLKFNDRMRLSCDPT